MEQNENDRQEKKDKRFTFEVNGEKWYNRKNPNTFPYPVVATIAFLLLGFIWGLWHPGWMVFLTIPIYYGIVNAIKSKTISYTIIVTIIYVAIGLIWGLWHPGWIIFLTIPIIHWFTGKR